MSSSDDVGNGVRASGNVINNNGTTNLGVGAGGQNFGQGAGSQYNGPGAGSYNYGSGAGSLNYGPGAGSNSVHRVGGNVNIGPGAGGNNRGTAAGGINTFYGPANFASEKMTAEKSVGRGTESAPIKTENSHGAEKAKDEGFRGNIDINEATPKESKSDVGDVAKGSISNKREMDVDKPTISAAKKVASPNEAEHSGQPSSVLTKSSKADELALRLLKNLNERNEDRNVSLDQFDMVLPNSPRTVVGKFAVPVKLQKSAHHLLNIFPDLTTHSKAKKVMIEETFSNLSAAMQYMEVTPFTKMNEDFFYLCRDAIDDAESINFEVGPIRAHLLNLAQAYLGKVKFGMAGGNTIKNLDEQIEQAKHVEEMEKSLAKMNELILKLEEGLTSIKAHLESLNQEKECLSSNGMTKLCQTCIKIAKTFGDKPGLFQP